MADDTRQPREKQPREDLSREALTVDKNYKAFSGEQWKGAKQELAPANMLAGGTQNTAGGKIPEVSIGNAFPSVGDFAELPRKPCVRESVLTGLGTGFGVGGVRALFSGSLFTACSWFVAGTCITSGIMYQYCLYARQAEKSGMMRAMEILNQKEEQKKAREAYKEKQREDRRMAKDGELNEQYAKLREAKDAKSDNGNISKPWWKVW